MAKVKVEYTWYDDHRIIFPSDVKPHGVELSHKLEWRGHGDKIVIDASEKFIEILKQQGHFKILEVNDDGSDGDVLATASDPSRVETVVAKDGDKPTQKSVVAPK